MDSAAVSRFFLELTRGRAGCARMRSVQLGPGAAQVRRGPVPIPVPELLRCELLNLRAVPLRLSHGDTHAHHDGPALDARIMIMMRPCGVTLRLTRTWAAGAGYVSGFFEMNSHFCKCDVRPTAEQIAREQRVYKAKVRARCVLS